MDKVIITCAATDGQLKHLGKDAFPAVPHSQEEIVESVYEAYKAGASVAHIHGPTVRKTDRPSVNPEGWRDLTLEIRKKCPDMIIQFGVAGALLEERARHFEFPDAMPDMLSVCLTSHDYNFEGVPELYIVHQRNEIKEYIELCNKHSVVPEFEYYNMGAIYNFRWATERAPRPKPYWFTLFFGSRGGIWSPPTVDEMLYRVHNLPEGALFQASCYSGTGGTADYGTQIRMLTASMLLGGHVRIGIEDNPYSGPGVPAQSNAELVEHMARIATEIGRGVATPKEARAMIGIK